MTEKKKPVNSKKKGSGNERTIANLLSKHLAPMQFRKSESSGAIVGGKNFGTIGQKFSKEALTLFVGDVVPVNESEVGEIFRFVVEAKAYKEAERVHKLLDTSIIYKWMEEIREDAKKVNKEPILIFKWNNTPYMAAVNQTIVLPVDNLVAINNGIQFCLLEDLLPIKDFWINIKNKTS